MPVSLTVRQLFHVVESGTLQKLMRQDLPASSTWKIARMIRRVEVEYKDAATAKAKMFTDENSFIPPSRPQMRQIKPELAAQFERDPFFERTIELDAEPITQDELEGGKLSAADLMNLGPLAAW